MPDIDPISKYRHLVVLAREYTAIIDQIEKGGHEPDDIRRLLGDRSIWHDYIIAELERIGEPVTSREQAMKQALRIARWFPLDEEENDV